MKKIKIITGKIRIGKTTFIKNNILGKGNFCGIVQPQLSEKRFFENIETQEKIEITSVPNKSNSFKLGKYTFSKEAFEWAKRILRNILNKNETINVVVDEYGPLEFSDKGLEPEISLLVKKVLTTEGNCLTIVVREKLLKEFITKFHLNRTDYEIIEIN